MNPIDAGQIAWQGERVALLPAPWRKRVKAAHDKRLTAAAARYFADHGEGLRQANMWLLKVTERIKAIKVPITLTDEQLRELAATRAQRCARLAEIVPGFYYSDKAALRRRMAVYVGRYGVAAPRPRVSDDAAIARMTCEQWWRRALRRTQARALEREAISLGYVHKAQEIYASSITVERRTQQRKRNSSLLAETAAVNLDTGELYTLAELAAKSVANPTIRRDELMVRINGFERMAKTLGHVAEFITLTAPSQFHPKTSSRGQVVDNPKYRDHTPRDTNAYLNTLWQRIRAKLQRQGVRAYGFRMVEAHHDGTPHWHLLLFVDKAKAELLRETFKEHAMRVDGDEPGAKKNRVKFVRIRPARGSAAGYVSKYTAKNIDQGGSQGGSQVQTDFQGEGWQRVTASHRIEAWASTWGIRQFQQIGGPPVGVWRELRRTVRNPSMSDELAAAVAAADKGDWARYLKAMGGPTVERRNLPIRVAYTQPGERWDFKNQCPYPANRGRYGEDVAPAVIGVREVRRGRLHQSRRYRWQVQPGAAPKGGYVRHNYVDPLNLGAAPWSTVNNCTVDNFHQPVDNFSDGHKPVEKYLIRGPNREKRRVEPQTLALFDDETDFEAPTRPEDRWNYRPISRSAWINSPGAIQ
jgi:hypothetical protein